MKDFSFEYRGFNCKAYAVDFHGVHSTSEVWNATAIKRDEVIEVKTTYRASSESLQWVVDIMKDKIDNYIKTDYSHIKV